MTVDVEKKIVAILEILRGSANGPMGARVISQKLKENGVDLSERTVRYHLKLMDERGFTECVGHDGRVILKKGIEEAEHALVSHKVGMVNTKMDALSYLTTFDLETKKGNVVINLTFFPERQLPEAKKILAEVFNARLCVSSRIKLFKPGEKVGGTVIPPKQMGMATVCGATLNGIFLKNFIPVVSRFGGILEMKNGKYTRYVEIINYDGTSIDPAEIFLKGKMASVYQAARHKNGKVLAGFREIPYAAKDHLHRVMELIEKSGFHGVAGVGAPGQSLFEVEPAAGRCAVVILGGLNPVAALEECGIETQSYANKDVLEYSTMTNFFDLL